MTKPADSSSLQTVCRKTQTKILAMLFSSRFDRSIHQIERPRPKSINIYAKYMEAACACVATHLDRSFSSSIVSMMAYKERYISETDLAIGLKFRARLVLMQYCRYNIIHDFHEKSNTPGFPRSGYIFISPLWLQKQFRFEEYIRHRKHLLV